ncbi:MAG: GAF domain-containing protein, partial [Anaerolineales bacterium]
MVVDAEEQIIYANSSAETIFGLPINQLIRKRLNEFTTPATFELIKQQTQKRRSGNTNIYEIEIIRPDGETRNLYIIATPRFEGTQYIGATGVLVDITEQKCIEKSLRENQENLRTLYDTAQHHVSELSLVERVHTQISKEIEVSELLRTVVEAVAESFGYTQVSVYLLRDECLVMQYQTGYENILTSIPINKGITGKVIRNGQAIYLENAKSDPDFIEATEDVMSEICVPFFDRGRIVGVFNVESVKGVKLTEADFNLIKLLGEQISIAITRANLYEKLRESETSYRTLANNLPGIVYRVHLEKDGAIEFFNNGLSELTGFAPNELN